MTEDEVIISFARYTYRSKRYGYLYDSLDSLIKEFKAEVFIWKQVKDMDAHEIRSKLHSHVERYKRFISKDSSFNMENKEVSSKTESIEDGLEKKELIGEVYKFAETLPPNQKFILKARLNNVKLRVIAKKLNLSTQYVFKKEKVLKRQLKDHLVSLGWGL